jgi:hypothetical protein
MRAGNTPDEWFAIAAKFLEVDESDLRNDYRNPNANNGNIRMWLGNQMRLPLRRKARANVRKETPE